MKQLKVGIIGFGLSGRYFHTPLLQAHGGFKIEVVSSSRITEVQSVLPNAKVVSDPYELIHNKDLDLIINCAPNALHYTYSAAALENGKHVVVEKPFVNTIDEGEKLIALAEKNKKIISVFHNRRWDSDFLTVKKLIQNNTLGEIKQFESHFDRWRPVVRSERWKEQAQPGAGLFYDLGPHLIDQALNLFGKPEEIMADIAIQRDNGLSDDYFHLILKYKKMRVILHSTSFSLSSARFEILAEKGQFVIYGLDPQEQQLKMDIPPSHESFGIDEEQAPASFYSLDKTETISREKGKYSEFYKNLYAFIAENHGQNPVSAYEALEVIKILELARESAASKKSITL